MKPNLIKTIVVASMVASLSSCGTKNAPASTPSEDNQDLLLFVGSYASPEEEGINLYSFNQADGSSRHLAGLAGVSNPSFLTIGSGGNLIYSVGEDEGISSTINTIALDRDSMTLSLVASNPTGGGAPCHVTLRSSDGRDTHVMTANYLGGSATIYALGPDGVPVGEAQIITFSGSGPVEGRQDTPHAHFVTFTPDSTRMIVTDLGTDRLHVFPAADGATFVDEAAMTDVALAPGAGPRHIDWHPTLPVGYLIDEIDGNVNVLTADSLRIVQIIQADSVGAQGSGDIHVSPDGRFLYASNRLQADGIAIFSIDPSTGLLTHEGYQLTGIHPRNFAITPNGRFMLVACRDDNAIEVYAIDNATGALAKTDRTITTQRPVCLKFAE